MSICEPGVIIAAEVNIVASPEVGSAKLSSKCDLSFEVCTKISHTDSLQVYPARMRASIALWSIPSLSLTPSATSSTVPTARGAPPAWVPSAHFRYTGSPLRARATASARGTQRPHCLDLSKSIAQVARKPDLDARENSSNESTT